MTARPTAVELGRLRRRVHAVLAAALVVSVAANVTAAQPTWAGRAVAAWPPLALLLVVDVLGKTPVAPGWLGRISVAATGLVAAVAAVASFTHMRHVAHTAGESPLVAVLFPLSVDGTAIVASIALIEINRQPNRHTDPPVTAPADEQPDTPSRPAPPINHPISPTPVDAGPDAVPVFTGTVVNGSQPHLNREGA